LAFKPATWYPIALVVSGVNLVSIGFAIASGEPLHAVVHASLALAFWSWAQSLKQRRAPGGGELQGQLDALSGEVGKLQQELGEIQERLDFAERVLAKGSETRRPGPERQDG
jgi:hypothetical protein